MHNKEQVEMELIFFLFAKASFFQDCNFTHTLQGVGESLTIKMDVKECSNLDLGKRGRVDQGKIITV